MKKRKTIKGESAFNRRDFLKIGTAGAALGTIGIASATKKAAANIVANETNKVIVNTQDDFPNEVRSDYKSIPSYSTVHGHGFFGRALMAMGIDVDKEAMEQGDRFIHHVNYEYTKDKKGFDQLAKAVVGGAWALCSKGAGPMPGAVGDFGLLSWDNNKDKYPLALMDNDFVQKEKYDFESKQQAADAIKRAARLYGADLVGITKRDPRWDYTTQFNPIPPLARKITPMGPQQFKQLQDLGGENMKMAMDAHTPDKWLYKIEERAGFKPKSVIVMAFEMDYEAISCASNEISSATVAEGYSRMTKSALQLAVMIRQLGYNAIPCGNDTGMSIPYAIAAGLGEGSRSSQLVTFKYGPRVRIAKVYTDFDILEYDKPKTFGVEEFCKRCKRCADACPSKALPFEDEPTFEPTHEHKDNAYFNAPGVKKWYLDAKKCFKQWADSGTDCTNCIAACPYNKPDFWHHRLVDGITAAMPGSVHSFMREMDIVFGYGNVDDEKAVDRFFDPKDKGYDGF
jgi:epoxyqueuosine reductase